MITGSKLVCHECTNIMKIFKTKAFLDKNTNKYNNLKSIYYNKKCVNLTQMETKNFKY